MVKSSKCGRATYLFYFYLINTVDSVVCTNVDAVGQLLVSGGRQPVVVLHLNRGGHQGGHVQQVKEDTTRHRGVIPRIRKIMYIIRSFLQTFVVLKRI